MIVEVIKALFGLLDLAILGWLVYAIVSGEVHEQNSFGLGMILGGLIAMGTAWGSWAFQRIHNGSSKDTSDKGK